MTGLATVLVELGLKKDKKKYVNLQYMLPKLYAPWQLGHGICGVLPQSLQADAQQYNSADTSTRLLLYHTTHITLLRPFHVAAGTAN
jgi:hypothetical protein